MYIPFYMSSWRNKLLLLLFRILLKSCWCRAVCPNEIILQGCLHECSWQRRRHGPDSERSCCEVDRVSRFSWRLSFVLSSSWVSDYNCKVVIFSMGFPSMSLEVCAEFVRIFGLCIFYLFWVIFFFILGSYVVFHNWEWDLLIENR